MKQNSLSRKPRKNLIAKQLGASAPAAVAILLFLAPSLAPAALAYPVTDTTFAGGYLNLTMPFSPGNSTAVGPSLRLLTNATYTGAAVEVTGTAWLSNYTAFRSSSGDFNAGQERTHLSVFMGSMSLSTTTAVSVFNASNNFGNGTTNGTASSGGRITLNGTLSGTFTTATIDANGAPWGFVFVDGRALPPSTIAFNILDLNGTQVLGGLKSGARVPLALDLYPSLKLQLVLATSDPLVQPEATSFGIGNRAADFSVPGNVTHTSVATENLGDRVRTMPAPATLNKDAFNPVVNVSAATYYSAYLSQPFVLEVGGTHWMYFAAGTGVGHTGAGIGRATSSDLRNWSVDASILMSPTAATYDAWAMTHPYVFADPEGSGYIMLYTAWTSSVAAQVARATSPDGIAWTKTGVVLGPSASLWDSFAVGQVARVEYDSGTDTYTMYYSGTQTTTGGGNALGRATSNDGVSWTPDAANPLMDRTVGGPDQDEAQGGKITAWAGNLYYYYTCINGNVSTCLAVSTNGASWGKVGRVINTTASSFDSSYASDPHAVLAANGTLHVFYAGFDGSKSLIGRTTAPFQSGEWTGRFDLLAAPTPDWVTFAKNASNPVIAVAPGTYYSGYLSQPQVVKVGGSYWMYLSAGQGPGFAGATIARATSNDLVTWTMDPAPLLNSTNTSYDAGGLIHPYVVENPFGTGYFLYYTGISGSGIFSIDLATSQDGLNWTKVGAVLNASGFGWDAAQVSAPAYIKYNASADRLRMWYAGYDNTGATSVGIASSPDGITWTRIVFQPVLPHGGVGSVDQDMAQGGKIVEMRSTLVFYYTCNPGTGRINTCMALSLDGGFSFTKRGAVLNTSGGGFDSTYAADPAAVLTGNSLLLFYAGYDGSTSQIGVARGVFDPSAPNAWLGAPQQLPRSISSFIGNVSAGAGVTATFSIRTSFDGVNWGNYEAVSSADFSVFTQIQRYLQYRIVFSAGAGPSVFKSAYVTMTSYFESGRYRSDVLAFPATISRANLDIGTTGSGRIDWYIEAGALGAVLVTPNDWVDLTGGGANLVVRADFWGAASETPVVLNFTLRVQAEGVPADVTIRVGNAAPRAVQLGNLLGTVRFNIPAADLTAAVDAALFINPAATFTNAILNFTSSHFGTVRVSNLTLDYILKNPINAAYLPPGTAATARENATSQFSVNASTCCGSTVNYAWYRDGAAVTPQTPTSYAWTPTFDDSGPHTVTVQMNNGELTVTHTWAVTVLNEDRPPVILGSTPGPDPSNSYEANTGFSIETTDPDGDAISFTWSVDGDPWDATSNETTIFGLAAGIHQVTVTVWDGGLSANYTWALTLTDSPPDAAYLPATPLTMSHAGSITFQVTATDPDGDMVTYRWSVGGVARPETSATLAVVAPPAGSFTVRVVVTGGHASTTHDWLVDSTDNAPTAVFGPADTTSMSHTASVEFSAEGSDPDGDEISYSWSVDGAPVSTALFSKFTLASPSVGVHNLTVYLQAGVLSLTHKWTVTSTNALPSIGGALPAGGKGLDTRAAQTFTLTASDSDGDALTYSWTMNNKLQNATGASFTVPAGLAAGPYTVTATVTDAAGGTTESTWTFTVPPAAADPAVGGLGLMILLPLALAAAVAAVFLMRRRKGKGPESAGERPPKAAAEDAAPAAPEAPPQDAYDSLYGSAPEAPPSDEYDSLYRPPPQ